MFMAMIAAAIVNLFFFIVSSYYAFDRGFDEGEFWVEN